METNIFDIANYILEKLNYNITNMKLQKLVFYANAYSLANFNKSLIEDEFEAWVYGPVHRELYLEFCKYKYKNITIPSSSSTNNELDEKTIKSINYIIDKYGHLEATDLSEKTHNEDPWVNAFNSSNWEENIIKNSDIKKYYKKNQL